MFYVVFLLFFYGLVFSASLAVLLKHQRRVARRHRRRLERRSLGGVNGSGGAAAAALTRGSSDVWGNTLSVKEIGDLAWGKFLVWAGFRPACEGDRPDNALSAVRSVEMAVLSFDRNFD